MKKIWLVIILVIILVGVFVTSKLLQKSSDLKKIKVADAHLSSCRQLTLLK